MRRAFELALELPENAALQRAVAAESVAAKAEDVAAAAWALGSEHLTPPVAVAALRVVEAAARTGADLGGREKELFASFESLQTLMPHDVRFSALLVGATLAKRASPPPGFYARVVAGLLESAEKEKLVRFFGAVTFVDPEPLDAWTALVAVAHDLLPAAHGELAVARLFRFFHHAASAGAGTWDQLAKMGIVGDIVRKAAETREPVVDKWMVAISEAALCFPCAADALVRAGGLDHIAVMAGSALERDASSARKLARIAKLVEERVS